MPIVRKENVFRIVADACAQAVVPVVLIGGYALGAYGHQRLTRDVDFMISDESVEKLAVQLNKKGYREVLRSSLVIRFATEREADILIDLMLVDSKTFDKVKAGAKEEIYGGRRFLVPKLEHLIALKLHALREQFEKRQTKDLPDIVELVKRNQVNVRSPEFRELCLKFGTPDIYQKILASVTPNG